MFMGGGGRGRGGRGRGRGEMPFPAGMSFNGIPFVFATGPPPR